MHKSKKNVTSLVEIIRKKTANNLTVVAFEAGGQEPASAEVQNNGLRRSCTEVQLYHTHHFQQTVVDHCNNT